MIAPGTIREHVFHDDASCRNLVTDIANTLRTKRPFPRFVSARSAALEIAFRWACTRGLRFALTTKRSFGDMATEHYDMVIIGGGSGSELPDGF
jgi:hypothetical protein